jgi:hypothetical protein
MTGRFKAYVIIYLLSLSALTALNMFAVCHFHDNPVSSHDDCSLCQFMLADQSHDTSFFLLDFCTAYTELEPIIDIQCGKLPLLFLASLLPHAPPSLS